jgi:hypothetical protein
VPLALPVLIDDQRTSAASANSARHRLARSNRFATVTRVDWPQTSNCRSTRRGLWHPLCYNGQGGLP